MEKKPVEVVISREKWGRGNPLYSELLISESNSDENLAGKMCCLGFAARQAGLRASDIKDVSCYEADSFFSPSKTALSPLGQKLYKKFLKLFRQDIGGQWTTSALHGELIRINDDAHLREDIREARLTELGLKAGIRFTFVD